MIGLSIHTSKNVLSRLYPMPSNGHTYANVVRFTLASYGIAVRGKRNEIGGGSEPLTYKF